MKVTNSSSIPVYTVAGSSTSRTLPEWLVRKKRRHLKDNPEWANRVELLQDFAFEEASSCVRVSEDGNWVMSTGMALCVHDYYPGQLAFANRTITPRDLQASNTCALPATPLSILFSTHRYSEQNVLTPLVRLFQVSSSANRPLSRISHAPGPSLLHKNTSLWSRSQI